LRSNTFSPDCHNNLARRYALRRLTRSHAHQGQKQKQRQRQRQNQLHFMLELEFSVSTAIGSKPTQKPGL